MAIVTMYDISVLDGISGSANYTRQAANQVSIYYPASGVGIDFLGSFTYFAGELSGGSFTGINYFKNGNLAISATGLNFTYSQFQAASLLGQTDNLFYGGDDQITGSLGAEKITSHNGNDTVIALDGDDMAYGGAGNDDVNGNKGEDLVHGDDGADFVRGGQGNDTVFGDAGDDPHVNGNLGDDSVSGGIGNDTLYGGQGADTLYGDSGIDLLSGDLGNDVLYGGTGGDHFTIRPGGGVDWVADFKASEGDRIELAAGTPYTLVNSNGQVMLDLGGGTQIGLVGVSFSTFSSSWIAFA